MNPFWAFLFKDKYRTPFSAYKMSLSELLVLGGLVFGMGYGLSRGISWVLNQSAVSRPNNLTPL